MIFIWNRKEVYNGFSIDEFNRIKDILSEREIKLPAGLGLEPPAKFPPRAVQPLPVFASTYWPDTISCPTSLD